jgi:Domain of unknown function (DUF4132)
MQASENETQAQQLLEQFETHANITKFFGKNPERSELEVWLLALDPNVRVILERLLSTRISSLVEATVKRSESNGETVALLGPKLEKALRELLPKLRAGLSIGAVVAPTAPSLNADVAQASTSSNETNPPTTGLFQQVTNAARNLFQTILPATNQPAINQNTENDLDNQAGRMIQFVLNEARKLETKPIDHNQLTHWPEILSANPEMQSRIVVETIKYLTVSRGTWGVLLQQNEHLRTLLAGIVNALLDRKLEFNTVLSDRVLDYLRHPNSWHSSSIGLNNETLRGKIRKATKHDFVPVLAGTAEADPQALIKPFIERAKKHNTWGDYDAVISSEVGLRIINAPPEVQREVFMYAVVNERFYFRSSGYVGEITSELLRRLVKQKPPFSGEDAVAIINVFCGLQYLYSMPVQAIMRGLEPVILANQSETMSTALQTLKRKAMEDMNGSDARKLEKLLDELLVGGSENTQIMIQTDDWGVQAKPAFESLEPKVQEAWAKLLRYAGSASSAVPSNKWLEGSKPVVNALGQETLEQLAAEWFGFVRKMGGKLPEWDVTIGAMTEGGALFKEANSEMLRGLAFIVSNGSGGALAAGLGDAAIACFKKLGGHGPRSAKVGNACVFALARMRGMNGVGQLERVRLNTKQPQFLKGIEKALEVAAERSGMTREDLEELTVPTFDLVLTTSSADFGIPEIRPANAERTVTMGTSSVTMQVIGSDVKLNWFGSDGKARKSEPSEIKTNFKTELKNLKRERDDLENMLKAQTNRIERMPLAQRSWTWPDFNERYLEHALVGCIARNLIWRFQNGETTQDGIWHAGTIVTATGNPLEVDTSTTVTPWHPVHCDASEVLAWREYLEANGIQQPFKQAHREVYILTEAEIRTRTYSNRFAAHILKQHQFNALCAARGWRNQLRLMVDDSYEPARLELPKWNLRAEYWVEGAGDDFGTDTNDTGTYLYLATDQVRFYEIDAHSNYAHAGGGGYEQNRYNHNSEPDEPIPLENIPAVVLSEVLRDVDLFVGVASVGNDPTWVNGGPEGHREYWQSYSFGDLSATAESRRATLEMLVPRLKIKDRASVDGRFLKVRGDIRTYKIHLGSGNILMEPNDQYLCIVPGSARDQVNTSELRLPFEGDRVLAIILSKAFMLAEDKKITDETITRQLGR